LVQSLIKNFNENKHIDFHLDIFDTLDDTQRENFAERDLDFSTFGKLLNMRHLLDEESLWLIEDFYEDIEINEEMEFWDNFESLMYFEYETLLDIEEFQNKLFDMESNIELNYKKLLFKYSYALNHAHQKVLHNMINDIDSKQLVLAANDKVYEEINKMKLNLIELARKEIYLIELKKLPIYDWSTNNYIDENMDLLMKECPTLLFEKMDLLDKELDKVLLGYEEKKKL